MYQAGCHRSGPNAGQKKNKTNLETLCHVTGTTNRGITTSVSGLLQLSNWKKRDTAQRKKGSMWI